MTIKIMLKLVIYESLPHEFANNFLNVSFLFKETIIFTYFNLIILNQLQ